MKGVYVCKTVPFQTPLKLFVTWNIPKLPNYVPWVHHESPEEVGPCDVVYCVLFRDDGSSNELSIQVVCQHLEQAKHWDGKRRKDWKKVTALVRGWRTEPGIHCLCTLSSLGIPKTCVYYTVSLFSPSSITIHCNSEDEVADTRVRQNLCWKDTAEFLHLQAKSHWKPLGDIGSYSGKLHIVAPVQ